MKSNQYPVWGLEDYERPFALMKAKYYFHVKLYLVFSCAGQRGAYSSTFPFKKKTPYEYTPFSFHMWVNVELHISHS